MRPMAAAMSGAAAARPMEACHCFYKKCGGQFIPRTTKMGHEQHDRRAQIDQVNSTFREALVRGALQGKVQQHMDSMSADSAAEDALPPAKRRQEASCDVGPTRPPSPDFVAHTPPCSGNEEEDARHTPPCSDREEGNEFDDDEVGPSHYSERWSSFLSGAEVDDRDDTISDEEDEEDESAPGDADVQGAPAAAGNSPRVDAKSELYLGSLALFLTLRLKSEVSIAGERDSSQQPPSPAAA